MLQAIRNRITPSAVIATLALVVAMTGGAYAANRYLITSTKQISPKVLKTLKGASGTAGAPGAAGPAGPAGLQGPGGSQGPAGPGGPQGPKGETGTPGAAGKDGKNGTNGTNGTTGFTETLPAGKTETGTWSFGVSTAEQAGKLQGLPLSFSIPLATGLTTGNVHYVNALGEESEGVEKFGTPVHCLGSAAAPTAPAGELCVYADEQDHVEYLPMFGFPHSYRTGTVIGLIATEEEARALGTWAVTAP